MVKLLFFNALLMACCGYALWRGGAPERIGAAIILFGTALTVVAASGSANRFGSVEVGIFVVDVAGSVAFLILALRAERFWPLWMTALQAIETAGHAVKLVDPIVMRWAYAFVLAIWMYPMLVLLAVGTWRHQTRLTRFGEDRSWSNFSAPSAPQPEAGPSA